MLQKLRNMHSENIGGLLSLTGSLVALFSGDIQGVGSTVVFIVSEVIFAYFGHTIAGYSLGYLGLAMGDLLLCFSHASADNHFLLFGMLFLSFACFLGSLRYPLSCIVHLSKNPKGAVLIIKLVEQLPLLISFTTLILRIPIIFFSLFLGSHVNMVLLCCNILWGLADVFLGRVQRLFKHFK